MTTGFFTKDDNETDTVNSTDGFWGTSASSGVGQAREEAGETKKTDKADKAEAYSAKGAAVRAGRQKASESHDDVVPPWYRWRNSMSTNFAPYDEYDPRNDYMPYVEPDSDSGSDSDSDSPDDREAPLTEAPDTEYELSLEATTSLPRIEAKPSGELLPQIEQPVAAPDTAGEIDDYQETQDQSKAVPYQQDYDRDDELSWDDDLETFADTTGANGEQVADEDQFTSEGQLTGEDQVADEEPAQEAYIAPGSTAVYEHDSMTNEGEGAGPSGKRPFRNILIAAGVVVALVGVYAFGVWYFSTHYLPNTRINGLPVATKTVGGAQSALEEETADYTCTVSIDDFSTTIHGTDIQMGRDEESMASEAMAKQSSFGWPIALVMPQNVEVDAGVTYSEDALRGIFATAVDAYNEEKLPKTNASVDYDEETGLYAISGTTKGTMVDGATAVDAVLADVKAFVRESQPSSAAYVRTATAQDIPSYAHDVAVANAVYSTDIPILVNGEEVTYAYASENPTLLSIAQGPQLSVDEEQLRAWAEYSVTDAVFHMDDWSFYYLDVDKFVDEFAERLRTGNVEGYEAPTYDELRTEGVSRELAYSRGGWDSELGRYIDVDLEAQFARLFDDKGTVLWESAFVSGEVYAGRSTVTGVFSIYAMQTNTVLVGMDYNNDGQPDYESYVNYWMPFYGGYGLHDATWRANFGGEYYYYDGSHGCVNLPYSKAEELYGMTYVGETVNVHW